MKRTIITIAVSVVLLLVVPVTLVITGFATMPRFDETYYGELAYMYDRLESAEGKKIVLVGNSAVAFGVRSDLLENEFPGYTVVNFGLYGALGTKLMLDLSRPHISEGDIVVVMPEPIEQSMSLYFSAEDAWRAMDGDFSMLGCVSGDDAAAMAGNFAGYVGEKFEYIRSDEKAPGTGAYSQSAFDDESGEEVGYMTFDRPYNVMSGGYDPTLTTDFSVSLIGAGFTDYLNDYAAELKERGAEVYFGFVPANELMMTEEASANAEEYYAYLDGKLSFDLIGHPVKYVMDYRWFYDNNVHMNSAGMYAFTDMLAEDLKLALGITTPNSIEIPDMPEIPMDDPVTGDNKDADKFEWEIVSDALGEYVRLTGLTAEGKTMTEITLPSDYDGVPVREFAPEVFSGNTTISRITLPQNISRLYDNSFDGAVRLSALVFEHDSVLGMTAGEDFLEGADNCSIYLKKGVSFAGCAGGWEKYQDRVVYY